MASAAPKYRYVYLTLQGSNQQDAVSFLDPINPSQPEVRQLDRPVQDGIPLFPSSIWGDPTGKWLASLYPSRSTSVLRLTNLASWETQDIKGVFPYVAIPGYQRLAWSPDGRYVAFLMTPTTSYNVLDVYVYTLADKSLVNLTAGDVQNHAIIWSSDSAQLAVASGNCSTPEGCDLAMSVFDVTTHQSKQHLDLSKIANWYQYQAQNWLCNLSWSPDMRYITFVSICLGAWVYNGSVNGPEVYTWDRQTDKISALSNFVSGKIKHANEIQVGEKYHVFWYDAQTLIVGVVYGIYGPDTTVDTQTVAYEMLDGKTTVLSPKAIDELAINPASKELALREISLVDDELKVKSASARTSAYSKGTLLTSATIDDPGACDFSWSPDGAFLAYARHTGGDCSAPIQSIVFRDNVSGKITERALPSTKGTVYDRIVPVGWVSG